MKDFTVYESEDGEVTMGGMLTIENAAAVRNALLEIVRRGGRTKITVREDAVVDLSFLQIICSMCRAAMRERKVVTRGSYSAVFLSAILSAGFARKTGCTAGEENNCLWTIGGKND